MILSARAQKLISTPSPLVSAHFEAESDRFDPQLNPKGAINLGTAENHLMDAESRSRIKNASTVFDYHLHYAEFRGIYSLRVRLAEFLKKISGINGVTADHIVIGNGVSSLLESLAYALFDAGDSILIPAPCYSGYFDDFSARFGVNVIAAPMSEKNNFQLEIDRLEHAYRVAEDSGASIKAVLLNSPNNPLGHVHDRSQLRELVEFAKRHQLQIIADEIYAHSIHAGGRVDSLLEIGSDYRGSIHMLYGLAKDFGLSGVKFGFIVSHNSALIQALSVNAYFYNVSTYTQALVEQLLVDHDEVKAFIHLYQTRLVSAYEYFKSCNGATINIPYISPQGGHFVFMDLSRSLQRRNFEDEMSLFNKIWSEARVNITPGQFFHCPVPGWFRLCFANEPVLIQEAFHRLEKCLQ